MTGRWHVSPTHWGEGYVERHCTRDDPEWSGGTVNGVPYARHKTAVPLNFETAELLAELLNKQEQDACLPKEP